METRQAKGRTASNNVQFRICAFPWRRVRNDQTIKWFLDTIHLDAR